ncbi:hypothetical protein GGI04_004212 [Coemansia thaxteri]|uniref:Uncharacterized protein n=1 Tax=Coemansia thaxteri TaxID=2663907 RepID=A0A9W8EFT9_9FUNG|nr:hypothetical protein GGI04_004212 [Coemansia thaxteri]KAJ2004276.1 hypothetical protein H4R26_002611 [Coemansia thaxteri]KAJ2473810.1 hypothetical protein EV174_005667 [Coemansia sp. RSA 2320]
MYRQASIGTIIIDYVCGSVKGTFKVENGLHATCQQVLKALAKNLNTTLDKIKFSGQHSGLNAYLSDLCSRNTIFAATFLTEEEYHQLHKHNVAMAILHVSV